LLSIITPVFQFSVRKIETLLIKSRLSNFIDAVSEILISFPLRLRACGFSYVP
jgi:hypothetical protein